MKNINMLRILLPLIFISLVGLSVKGDWSNCPSHCSCKWISGKKTANCKNHNLNFIPAELSSEIQIIDLSDNSIDRLPNEAFKSVNLVNLFKIYLRNCQVKDIDVDAFKGLGILIELNLSENRIHTIHPGTFKDTLHLKFLILSNNPIQKIEANLFNLKALQKLEMANCLLSEIGIGTFKDTTNLAGLNIAGNKLTTLSLEPFYNLLKLENFFLFDNPWNCDCHLRNLRNWVINKNLLTGATCDQPIRLRSKLWSDIEPLDFACKPKIEWPPPGKTIAPEKEIVRIGCRASGDPLPQVSWLHNSRIISEDRTIKFNAHRYITKTAELDEEGQEPVKWVNLTIQDVNIHDKGQLRCVAESPGGHDEVNVTFLLENDFSGVVDVAGYSIDSWPLIIGLATGLTALLIVICVIVCCLCCRYRQSKSSKSSVTNYDKQDESLLAVNPVQKPPRSYDTQLTPDEGVELSELNTKLLDENSLHDTVCTSEGNHSAECLDSIPDDRQDAYPPDLLSFPSRRYNTSPAGGSTTKAFDPLMRTPVSPGIHSLPLHRNYFGTLPYSRSHSPLTPGGPVVMPRQGYVTIPRRPRIPSWSSAPTPSLLDDPISPILAEPIYDNLGPRTTADGSSALSLNKTGLPDQPKKKKTPHFPYYFHFESPCPSPLAASSAIDKENIKREEYKKPPIAKNPEEVTLVKKVGPKPPPKPKKGGPLFEDEGEDGTEV